MQYALAVIALSDRGVSNCTIIVWHCSISVTMDDDALSSPANISTVVSMIKVCMSILEITLSALDG